MSPGPWGEQRIEGARLRLERVSFHYPGGVRALEGVSLDVAPGSFVALMGANGGGKSTLLKLVTGLLEPSEGRVLIDDVVAGPDTFSEVAARVGYLFQDPNDQLFCATVADDIAYGPENLGLPPEYVERRSFWAASVCGVEELLSRPIHALSYGQKKRVALAGVLAMRPRILVLDEPTASLDPMAEGGLMRLLRHLNLQGLTVLMATHDVDLIPLYADRIALLRRGRVVMEGPLEEVFSDGKHLEACDLRLPRISYLFEIFCRDDERPLTVGQARKTLVRMVEEGQLDLVPILLRDASWGA